MVGGKSLIKRMWKVAITIRDKLTGRSAYNRGKNDARRKYTQKYGRDVRRLEAQIKQRSKDFLNGTKFGFLTQFRIKRNGDDGDTGNDK